MSEDLPKQEMLAKLLRMTTSPNDGEALVAIRKANNLLKTNGWDWDKLLQGKIRIAADPFANLGTPQNDSGPRVHPQAPPRYQANPTPPPPRPRPAPPPKPTPPPPPPPPPKPHEPWSHQSTNGQSNLYPGNCYVCGYAVSAKDGKLFKPKQFNKYATSDKKHIICDTCDHDRHAHIDSRPAAQIRTTRPFTGAAPKASDL